VKKIHTAIALVGLLAASTICSAAGKPNVSTVPISNRLIQGEIRIPGGEVVKFTTQEGGLVSVQGEDGIFFGVAGEILDVETGHVRFTVFEIEEHGPGLHGLKEVAKVEVRDQQPMRVPQIGIEALFVSRIEAAKIPNPPARQ
jgi:hypothetical protein